VPNVISHTYPRGRREFLFPSHKYDKSSSVFYQDHGKVCYSFSRDINLFSLKVHLPEEYKICVGICYFYSRSRFYPCPAQTGLWTDPAAYLPYKHPVQFKKTLQLNKNFPIVCIFRLRHSAPNDSVRLLSDISSYVLFVQDCFG
jgi:hypothetical protein